MAVTLALTIAGGLWFNTRQRRKARLDAEEPILDTPIEDAEPPKRITFQCAGCRKSLQVDAGLAGRNAKCPVCATLTQVPQSSP